MLSETSVYLGEVVCIERGFSPGTNPSCSFPSLFTKLVLKMGSGVPELVNNNVIIDPGWSYSIFPHLGHSVSPFGV